MKVYTKTGDQGQTSLIGGTRVSKNDLRIEAYGCIDELRISDVALQPSQFLRFEPADADELVHISFDQHSLYGTAISTSANYNYRPDIVAKFERAGGSAAIDRATKCASKVRGGVFEPQVANDGSYRSEVDGSGLHE